MVKSNRTLVSKRGRITLKSVDSLKPGEQLWDSDIKGFVVRNFSTRAADLAYKGRITKTYGLKTRVGGRQRWITIGEHGVFTPEQARTEATKIKGLIATGEDPTFKREELRQALLFREVAERFLAEHCGLADTKNLRAKPVQVPGAAVKPGTARGYRDILRDHVLPALGRRTLEAVTTAEVAALHKRMHRVPYAANRMLSVISVMHSWARLNRLWKGPSPTEGIGRYVEQNRDRALADGEVARVVQAIADAEAGVPLDRVPLYRAKREAEKSSRPAAKARPDGHKAPGPASSGMVTIDRSSADALRLLLLTGLRPKEVRLLQWQHVNFATGVVRLEDTKTGDRDATFSTQALEFLATLPKLDGTPFVFPGRKSGRPLASLQNAFELVRELAGFGECDHVVLYTVRHNFGTTLANARVEAYELMRMMGHKNLRTSLRYIHPAQAGIQATVSKATAGIADALAAVKPRPEPEPVPSAADTAGHPANVLAFRKREG